MRSLLLASAIALVALPAAALEFRQREGVDGTLCELVDTTGSGLYIQWGEGMTRLDIDGVSTKTAYFSMKDGSVVPTVGDLYGSTLTFEIKNGFADADFVTFLEDTVSISVRQEGGGFWSVDLGPVPGEEFLACVDAHTIR